jgi:hypothetical protein
VCVASQDAQRQKALVVVDKTERVFRFHENTLKALKELVQAAGLQHPREISDFHIVRRAANDEVRLLANVLPLVALGSLLAPPRGEGDWPHAVFRLYWRWPAPTASPRKHPLPRRCRRRMFRPGVCSPEASHGRARRAARSGGNAPMWAPVRRVSLPVSGVGPCSGRHRSPRRARISRRSNKDAR